MSVAFAQAGWLGPSVPIAAPSGTLRSTIAPDVAADAAGNAIAVWWEHDTAYRMILFAARYNATSGAWSTPHRLTDPAVQTVLSPHVAVDADGNGIAIWAQSSGSTDATIYSARYDATSGAWAAAEPRSTGSAGDSHIAMTSGGDAVAVWSVYGSLVPGPLPGVYTSRVNAGTTTWSTPERLGPAVATGVPNIDVAVDDSGNAFVVWPYGPVEVRRYSAVTSTWSAAQALSAPLPPPAPGRLTPVPAVATNAAGDAVVSWTSGGLVQASRYERVSATWAPAVTIASGDNDSQRGVIDSAGNIVVAWHQNTVGARTLQASRFAFATLSWSAPRNLAPASAPIPLIFNYGAPALAVDTRDNVLVLSSWSPDGITIQMVSSFFAPATLQWTAAADLARNGYEARLPALAADGRGGAVAVWFEYGSLSTYRALRWTSAPAAPVVGTVTPAPGQLTLAFSTAPLLDPGLAATTLDYSLDDGATWTSRPLGHTTAPLVVTGLVDGVAYSLQLRMTNASGTGPATPTVRVTSGTGGAPDNFRVAARDGNRVTFAWTPPPAGLIPTSYELHGGVGGAVLAVVPTGGAATQFTVAVPDGSYFARVVGTASSARSLMSADATFGVRTTLAPAAPSHLLGSAAGTTLHLSWTLPLDGGDAPTSLVLQVSGSVATTVSLPPVEAFTFAGVPPGTYTFRVAATSAGSSGPASAPVTLTFPGTCGGPPRPPRALSASRQGRVVFVDWLPPADGEAASNYVVSVTGAYVGAFTTTARSLAVPVPAGSYTVRVASSGPCGVSAPTAPQTVVVP